jgi:serine/threonine protein kinase
MADRVRQQLGSYRLVRLLGHGGFAEVYLGEHVYLGKQAAVKVLHTQLSSSDAESFRLEAQRVSNLEHPHIVSILDFGLEGNTPFLVMTYAPGGTLRQRHPKGSRLPLPTVVSYVRQIAEALQYAHDQKLIHRDIKPENMLIGRRDEVLLGDFGIAAVVHSTSSMSAQLAMGTVPYMAPEQIQEHPRPASDQYALGVVVYEWLGGELPFHGSFTEIMAKHLMVPPPSLREKLPALSPAVEQVVMTALAKEPRQRFSQIQAFADALEQASQVEASQTSAVDPSSQSEDESTILSPSQPPAELVAFASQSSIPTELATPVSQSSIPTERSTPANPSSLPVLPVDTPAAPLLTPQQKEESRSVLARHQRIGFITAIVGSLMTMLAFFLPYFAKFPPGASLVALTNGAWGYGTAAFLYVVLVCLYLALLLAAAVLGVSQIFDSSARRRKNMGRFLIAFGLLEMVLFQVINYPFPFPFSFFDYFVDWGAGAWVSLLGMLVIVVGGILGQTDQWSVLTLQQRAGYIVVWVSRVVAFVAFLLPYTYVQFMYNGSVFNYYRELSGVELLSKFFDKGFSYLFFLLLEPAIVLMALFISRKLLIVTSALGLVLHLLLLFSTSFNPYSSSGNTTITASLQIGVWLYLLGMIGLIAGGVLTIRITKYPVAIAT